MNSYKIFAKTEQKTALVIHRTTGLSYILSVYEDVGIKSFSDPFDTRLLRALHSWYLYECLIIFSVHISDSQVLQLPE